MKKTIITIIITALITFMITSVGWHIYFGIKKGTKRFIQMDFKTAVRLALFEITEDLSSSHEELGKKKLEIFLEEWQNFEKDPNYKKSSMFDIQNKFKKVKDAQN